MPRGVYNKKSGWKIATSNSIRYIPRLKNTTDKFIELMPHIIEYVENKMVDSAKLYNKPDFESIFAGHDQETQKRTILFQDMFSLAIAVVADKFNFPLRIEEVDGSDLIITHEGIDILIEQKIRTVKKSEESDVFILFTGSSHAAEKVDIHLFMGFEIGGNKIYRKLVNFTSLKETGVEWSSSNSGYASIFFKKSETGYITYFGDVVEKRVNNIMRLG